MQSEEATDVRKDVVLTLCFRFPRLQVFACALALQLGGAQIDLPLVTYFLVWHLKRVTCTLLCFSSSFQRV